LRITIGKFDGARISDHLIEKLEQTGFPDLALALVENSPRYSPLLKADLAIKSFFFDKAYDLLCALHKSQSGK